MLLLDRDQAVRDSLALAFRAADFHVTAANSVPEVQGGLARNAYDVAVIDINGGEDSDLEPVRTIQKSAPELPVVLLTADPELTRHPLTKAARCSFSKPLLDMPLLIKALSDITGRSAKTLARQTESRP